MLTEFFDASNTPAATETIYGPRNYIEPKDVAKAINFILSTPPNVNVSDSQSAMIRTKSRISPLTFQIAELTIKPTGETV